MRTRRWETKVQVFDPTKTGVRDTVHRHIVVFSTEDQNATKSLIEEAFISGGERMGLQSLDCISFAEFMRDRILKKYNCTTLSELASYLERVWMSEEQ